MSLKRKASWDIPPWAVDPDADEDTWTPGQELLNSFLEQYFGGKLPATLLCIQCHWAALAGVNECAPFALAPGQSTGNSQKRVDKALGFKVAEQLLYPLKVPGKNHVTDDAELLDILVHPAIDQLALELVEFPNLTYDWRSRVHERWIEKYENHTITLAARPEERALIYPLALYLDATAFLKRDSILVVTVRFLFSTRRHLVVAMRKSSMCQCGCGGWCSLYEFWSYLAWDLGGLALGRKSKRGHDGRQLSDSDTVLGFRGVIVDVDGDWMEFSHRMGLPTWASKQNPCILCNLTLDEMDRGDTNFKERSVEEYDKQCSSCEKWVVIPNAEVHAFVKASLVLNNKYKGLALNKQVPSLKLIVGDRLEPSPKLRNTKDFDTVSKFPYLVLFWRAGPSVHHRHPLINGTLMSFSSFGIDVLHALHLGVYLFWCVRAIWLLILNDVFDTRCTRKEELISASLQEIKQRLHDWYPAYEASIPPDFRKGFTRINNFKRSMLGENEHSDRLKIKAAECRHFLPFLLEMVRKYEPHLQGVNTNSLLKSGDALVEYMEIMRSEPRKVSELGCSRLLRCCMDHNYHANLAGIAMKPKHHIFVHMTIGVPYNGNPRMYSTYMDESLNRDIACIAASCHRLTFERRVFAKFSHLQTKNVGSAPVCAWW